MNIGIITYNNRHLKTEQILLRLLQNYPDFNFKLFALPFVSRPQKERLIKHRPDQQTGTHPENLAKKYNLEFHTVNSDIEISGQCDYYLICGAGILSAEFLKDKKNKVINVHPGIIPAARGLDAFKWTIYEMKPLGITLHYIDEEVDKGEVISIIETPVFKDDDLNTLARRHYELEIKLMADFVKHLENPSNPFKNLEEGKAHKRMKLEREKEIIDGLFEKYKQLYAK